MKIVMFFRIFDRPLRKAVLELNVADQAELIATRPGQVILCETIRVKGKKEQLQTLVNMLPRVSL